jgi:hypothetical protein
MNYGKMSCRIPVEESGGWSLATEIVIDGVIFPVELVLTENVIDMLMAAEVTHVSVF